MSRKKLLIGLGLVVVLAGLAYANVVYRRPTGTKVTVERIAKRDLEAVVSASGTVQPQRHVDVSAEMMGKVTNLVVNEGDMVKQGQLLLQIDPRNLQSAVDNHQASLDTARATLDQTKTQVQNSRIALKLAQDTLQRQEGMFKAGLISRNDYDTAQADVQSKQTDLLVAQQSVKTQEQRIRQEEANLESAKYDLNKVRVVAPISGLVTRRSIEEGETVVTGTMNNAGTVLLTITDMSVIDTEIEVDETDIPYIKVGQPAKVTIDAIPDKTFDATVTEVGNSPIQSTGSTGTTGRATNFKVVVTLKDQVPNVRPGFTCTAEITTATRQQALSVPIQAMTVRELVVDKSGAIVPTPAPPPGSTHAPTAPKELTPGQTHKEFEGVFLDRDAHAVFVPVKTGIAGDKYFEVLDGLKAGDQVITGPFASVRTLKDTDPVVIDTTAGAVSSTPTAQ
jgi:HlyD family secretion protein